MMAEPDAKKGSVVKDSDLQKIKEFIEDIRFGSVLISVQDGRIVQIDKNEKLRLK